MQCKRNPSGTLNACLPCEVLTILQSVLRVKYPSHSTPGLQRATTTTFQSLHSAHYINSPKDQPEQWALKEVQLAFAPLEGSHSGENSTSVIYAVLKWYGICEKVCMSFTLCMATNSHANYL